MMPRRLTEEVLEVEVSISTELGVISVLLLLDEFASIRIHGMISLGYQAQVDG